MLPTGEIPEQSIGGIPGQLKVINSEKTEEPSDPSDPSDNENEAEIKEMTTDWKLAMKFVPYFTGAEKRPDANKYVSFDTFKRGCETADEFIEATDKKKRARIIWATKIRNNHGNVRGLGRSVRQAPKTGRNKRRPI